MTYDEAIKEAVKQAKEAKEDRFVIAHGNKVFAVGKRRLTNYDIRVVHEAE